MNLAKYTMQEFKERVKTNTLTLSYSGIKNLLNKNGITDFINYYTQPKKGDNDAFNFGKALHVTLLEYHLFAEKVAVQTKGLQGAKKELFLQMNADKEAIITEGEWNKIYEIRQTLLRSKLFQAYIEQLPIEQKEQHFKMELFGIPFEGFKDVQGVDYVLDIKSTGALSNFRYSIDDFSYDLQQAIYCLASQVSRFIILAIDKTSLNYQFFEFTQERAKNGLDKLKKAVSLYNSLRIDIDTIESSEPEETILFI